MQQGQNEDNIDHKYRYMDNNIILVVIPSKYSAENLLRRSPAINSRACNSGSRVYDRRQGTDRVGERLGERGGEEKNTITEKANGGCR